jgi:hypothetical protein
MYILLTQTRTVTLILLRSENKATTFFDNYIYILCSGKNNIYSKGRLLETPLYSH